MLNLKKKRSCPLCENERGGKGYFPFHTEFNNEIFKFLKCYGCGTVYVDPVPDDATFFKMYDKKKYHDTHYSFLEQDRYGKSARLLKKYINDNDVLLDWGCGLGHFLLECKKLRINCYGVDYDKEAALATQVRVGCPAFSVSDFYARHDQLKFDAIHLGDVLEHVENPARTLSQLLTLLDNKGVLFIEGPLEVNSSIVYWAARFFGFMKNIFCRQFINTYPPTHLFRANENSQKNFLVGLSSDLKLLHWRVYETGWPYINGRGIKKVIGKVAVFFSGLRIFGITFGNRFEAVLVFRR